MRILLIVLSKILRKIRRRRQKLDYFSPPSLHGAEAGGVPVLDFGCGSSQFTRDFLLQDFSPARHFDSGRSEFRVPVLVFPRKTIRLLKFSQSRHSILIMQHVLSRVPLSTLTVLFFLRDSSIIPDFVFPFLLD